MKKLTLALLSLLAFGQAKADEGMWTLYNLPQAVFEQMQAEGYSMPYGSLYSDENAIKNACVNFSGFCSGVVVSPNGLVFTNHHCGFGAINKHSTVEHDYMRNGFYAKTYEEELPNENMFVSFMVEQKDVTDKIVGMGIHNLTPTKQTYFLDSIENAWSKEVKKNDSTLRLELKPFYEGNKYFATTYRDFTDLRLVFTVPKSMGKYGGETDNWMWPRQTCDFSVFRIYADPKTNGPAAYSKDNVPYRPKSWAPVSLQGYKEGDFSMTIGYPGTTNRYLSSYGIRERRDAQNAPRAQVRGVKQAVMIKHMRASDAVRIKYETAYAQSSNYWKNSLGMNKCQEGMIGLFKAVRDFNHEKEASFFTFAEVCISRQLYSALEASNRKKHIPLNTYVSFSNQEESDGVQLEQIITEQTVSPEQILIEQEHKQEFFAKLEEKLSPMERKVLYLYLEGSNYIQIADLMGKTPKSIDNTLQRIRGKVKALKEEI